MITEIIRYKIPEAQASAFQDGYNEACKVLRASHYCQSYELLHGEDEPENWILVIRWSSTEEHLKGFRQSPEFPKFFSAVKPFFGQIQEMKHYESTPLSWNRG